MGTITAGCRIANHLDRTKHVVFPRMQVDPGSEYTWVPENVLDRIGIQREKKEVEFAMFDGKQMTRSIGFAVIFVGKTLTTDEVVFAKEGDPVLLGARTLQGLNLTIDLLQNRLVPTGPIQMAANPS